jgi:excisionase family DNA binding protein
MPGSRSTNDAAQPVRVYSVQEAARLLGVSDMTLYRQIRAEAFPAIRVGRRFLIPARYLEEMIAAAIETRSVVDPSGWL